MDGGARAVSRSKRNDGTTYVLDLSRLWWLGPLTISYDGQMWASGYGMRDGKIQRRNAEYMDAFDLGTRARGPGPLLLV